MCRCVPSVYEANVRKPSFSKETLCKTQPPQRRRHNMHPSAKTVDLGISNQIEYLYISHFNFDDRLMKNTTPKQVALWLI